MHERTERLDLQRFTVKGYRVEVVDGPDEGRHVVPRESTRFTVGSAEGNGLRLNDPHVSRHHLELAPAEHCIVARNLSTTNGSWCGGARFEELRVYDDTDLRVGSTTLRVSLRERAMSRTLASVERFGALVGRTPVMRALFHDLAQVAPHQIFVLITGETGTGKELAARALHDHGANPAGPFEVVDCTSLPRELAERLLFGAERGAYTGAVTTAGAFERAHGGTLFLDEIGELPVDVQSKLLRVIETRTVRRLGGSVDIAADARIVAATNRNLLREVSEGRFKHDLFHRMAGCEIEMPALREHLDDMDLLVAALTEQIRADDPRVRARAFTAEQIDELKRRDWPGNVRQLRQHLYRALIGLRGDPKVPPSAAGAEAGEWAAWFARTKDVAVGLFEREYLRRAWEGNGRNVTRAAEHAGMDRTAFDRALVRLGLKQRGR